jgi:hypothetical protein
MEIHVAWKDASLVLTSDLAQLGLGVERVLL